MKKIKTAIIGCGAVSDMYAQSIQKYFSILDLYACSDLIPERMDEMAAKFGLKAMTFQEILNNQDIEMIINLTPPAAHYSLTKQALEHGKHVYSEKCWPLNWKML